MTLHFERYAAPAALYSQTLGGQQTFGLEGRLSVVLVEKGRASFFQEEETVLAAAGSLVLACGLFYCAPVEECRLTGAVLQGAAADELCAGIKAPLMLPADACPGAAELLAAMADRRNAGAGEGSAAAYALLCRLAGASATPGQLPPLVAAAVALIRSHYAEVYGVEELAKELDVTKSHLVRAFAAATGLSPGRYLTAVRVQAAKRLLLQGEYTLETVAMLSGFSGANYLCKVFKKQTGQSPAAWRALYAPSAGPAANDEWENRLYL